LVMQFDSIPATPGMVCYGAYASGYTFVITYDIELKVYAASWKNNKFRGPQSSNFIGENIHPEAKLPYFETMHEAEQACKATLKQLIQKQ
jgi:hypothetical protein